jgi:hypothetical protein
MKYALISPQEPRSTGLRIAQVMDEVFPVCEPLYWVECPDDTLADHHTYDADAEEVVPPPVQVGPTQAELITATRKKAAELRLPIANILSDLQIDALVDGNVALATTIKTLKTGLAGVVNMDLSTYQTAEQMEDAVQAAYYQLALSAPEGLRSAFKSLVP